MESSTQVISASVAGQEKKVLFFTSQLGGGGAEMHLVRLLNHLQQGEFHPTLALARGGGSYEKLLDDTLPVVRFHAHNRFGSTVSLLLSVRPLRRLIKKLKPALVVTFLDVPAAIGYSALKGTTVEERPRFVACIQNNFSVKRQRVSFLLRWLNGSIRRAYASADHVVALSHGVAQDLIANIPECQNKTTVIFNAAWDRRCQDMSMQTLPRERPAGVPLLVACGRFTKQKGFEFLLQAVALVKKQRPIHLWLLGTGTGEQSLRTMANELQLATNIEFLGFQSNPFVYIKAADVFVLSSLWEGFGNVVAEALACGTPVVSTDCPFGPAEILDQGRFGRLARPGDAHDLASQILRLLDDPTEQSKLSGLGIERAKHFASDRVGVDYETLFDSLLLSDSSQPRDSVV